MHATIIMVHSKIKQYLQAAFSTNTFNKYWFTECIK